MLSCIISLPGDSKDRYDLYLLPTWVELFKRSCCDNLSLHVFAFATSYGLLVVVPMLFLLLMGFAYMVARAFGGQGTFLEQCDASLSIEVPLGILSKLLALIPGIGRILNSVLSLYGIVLQVFVVMAVHRLSKGKAIATILIPLVTIGIVAGAIFLVMKK